MGQSIVIRREQTLADAAVALRCSLPTLNRMLRAGAPCDRLGRSRVRVCIDELREWLIEREAARTAGGQA